MRLAGRSALAALVAAVRLASACTSGCSRQPQRNPAVFIPAARSGEVTFYLSLPSSTAALAEAAVNVSMPGSPNYRRFVSLDAAASRFGATDAQIKTVADAVKGLGLNFAVDPTRLFARVSGSIEQWKAALGAPFAQRAANASNKFTTYALPAQLPAALQPPGTAVLLPVTQVYDPSVGGSPHPAHPVRRRGQCRGRSTPARRLRPTVRLRCCSSAGSTRRSRSRPPTASTGFAPKRPALR
jgi:hypothetical protein